MKSKTVSCACLSLCLLALVSTVSCGDTKQPASTSSKETLSSVDQETTPVTEEAGPDHLDALGEYDFNGKTFQMLIRSGKINDIIAEEAIGEPFNDAVFNRNTKIAERFNIQFDTQQLDDDSGAWHKQISGSVMANDGAYDVVMPDYWWGCETGGYFLNLLNWSDIMDFSQPWWCTGWNTSSEIYGQMYSAVGSLCMDLYENAICTFFNRNILNNLDLASPYQLVDEGKWTLDKMLEMASSFSGDLNGDGIIELDNDNFGAFYDLQSGRALFPAFGWKTSTKQADGSYAYEFWNDSFIEMFNKIWSLMYETDYISYQGGDGVLAFCSDRLLFLNQGMGVAKSLRNMESDFGIVPYPKYTEDQDSYISYNFGTYYLAIPKSASDPKMSAVILEALNAESYHTVKDAYYEVNMKEKFSRDNDTQRMLDIVVDNIYFDFTFVNEAATDHIVMYFFNLINDKKPNVASLYEKKQKAFQKRLDKLFETYRDTMEE